MNLYKSTLFAESWNVAYREKKSDFLQDKETVFQVIPNPVRYWAADPFLFKSGDDTYIFAELYDYVRRRGIIGYYQINNPRKGWTPVIVESWHLSYPQIYRNGSEIYIMPEANISGTLYCYRAIQFPDKWERLEPIRTNVQYADTTLFQWKEKLLALAYEISGANYRLRLLDMETPKNDATIDIENIMQRRPAGAMCEAKCIRPAQNCLEDYGKGLIFYKYSLDCNMKYRESEIGRANPNEYRYSTKIFLDGMHTYNTDNYYEVVDIKTRRFNTINLIMRLFGKMRLLK